MLPCHTVTQSGTGFEPAINQFFKANSAKSFIQTIQTFQGYLKRSKIECVCGLYSGRQTTPVTPGTPGRGRS